jgi:predicted ATPase
MITKLSLRNFKCLRDVQIDLERFTVFVGANGSGKTSVLEAIHNAVRASTGDPQKVFAHERHGDWVYTRGGQGDLAIRCRTPHGEFGVEASPPPGYPPSSESLQTEHWNYRVGPGGPGLLDALEPARRLVFYHFDAAAMARPSYSEHAPPRVEVTGAGLASVLAYMALNEPRGFEQLVATARTLIPRLQGIRFRRTKVYRTERELVRFGADTVQRRSKRPYQGELILFDFEHAANISARTASEGTILMVGLLAVLLGPARPRIVLLDDLDQGLHPLAQKELVAVIGKIMEKFPDLQLLATTHSPFLLNYLSPEQVRIMAAGPDGYSLCGRLTDHPQFAKWKDEMAPGEMWSVFGEKWLAEKDAAP